MALSDEHEFTNVMKHEPNLAKNGVDMIRERKKHVCDTDNRLLQIANREKSINVKRLCVS